MATENGNGNGNGGSSSLSFGIAIVTGTIALISTLLLAVSWQTGPIMAKQEGHDREMGEWRQVFKEFITRFHDDAVKDAYETGKQNQLLDDRGKRIDELSTTLQKQVADELAVTDTKISALDTRLQAELKVKVDNLQLQVADATNTVEHIREKKIEDERQLSEVAEQLRAIERAVFGVPVMAKPKDP